MNLLKISGVLLLLNILLVQSFEVKKEYYKNKDCSGSPWNTETTYPSKDNLECVETNKIKEGNQIITNGDCIPYISIFGKKSTGLHNFVELGVMRDQLKGWEGFNPNEMTVKLTWSGWCDGSLPGWAIALIVLAVLGLLGVGIYFMCCREEQKPARSYVVPARSPPELEYPVAV